MNIELRVDVAGLERRLKAIAQDQAAASLKQRGWIERDVNHAWKWQKPPLPAMYRIEDALSLEMAQRRLEHRSDK